MPRRQRRSKGRESQNLAQGRINQEEGAESVDNVEILSEHASQVRISRSFNKSKKIKCEYMN